MKLNFEGLKLKRYKSLLGEDATVDLRGNLTSTGGSSQGDLNFTVTVGNRPPISFKLGKGKFDVTNGIIKIKPEAKEEVFNQVKKAIESTGLVKSGLKFAQDVLGNDLVISANKIELALKSSGEITNYKG